MRNKIFVLVLPLFLVLGCAALEEIGEHGDAVTELGESATAVGSTVSTFQPQIGVWILAIGGLAMAAGKVMKLLKKKEP